jgi:hypothetical protein
MTVVAGTLEVVLAAVIQAEGEAILGLESVGLEVGWACLDVEEAWAAGENQPIAGGAM